LKICFLIGTFFGGGDAGLDGTQVQTFMVARELASRGHEVIVVAGSTPGDRDGGTHCYEGISILSFRRPLRLPFLGARSASRAVRRASPDVVYVRGRSYLAGVAAWERWRRRTGFVWASNGEDGCERWKGLARLWRGSRPWIRKLLRTPPDFVADVMCDLGVPRADQHVCQTQHQCARLRAVHGRNGVVIRSLQVAPHDLPAKTVPPVVLWIGSIAPYRRPDAFVQLAADLADSDCDVVLLGPAPDRGYLEHLIAPARGLPRFHYVPPVPLNESWDWIARASVLVNTSLIEGVSNALVQAWHCGTPTVTLSLDPDGLIEHNDVGFRSGDLPTLARDIRRLLADAALREAMGARALALARHEFSRESVGSAYEAVMERAVTHA
jgi:glycosyltransferase involved in cell wall biosynthesis